MVINQGYHIRMSKSNEYVKEQKKSSIPDSRSRLVDLVIYEYDGKLFYETYDRPSVETNSFNDKIHVVQMGEEKNFPLISFLYYGTVELWWLIAEANDIGDPFDVHAGDTLVIPDLVSFYEKKLDN